MTIKTEFQSQRLRSVVLIAMALCLSDAQTLVDLRTQTKSVDFSGAVATKPYKSGTSLPAICSVGEAFFKTNATAGTNVYVCTSTNTWTLEGGTGFSGLSVAVNGAVQGTQPTLNLISGAGVLEACTNNSAASRVDCTPSVNTAFVSSVTNLQQGDWQTVNSTTGTTTYSGSPANGCGNGPTALTDRMIVWLEVDTASLTNATFNYCGLGVKNIKQYDGTTDPGTLIPAGVAFPLEYDAGNGVWRLQPGFGANLYYSAGGGTAQAQTATYSPPIPALRAGLQACWKPSNANTGAGATFSPNALAAHTIVKAGGAALAAGDLAPAAVACAIYDLASAQWELQNPQTTAGSNYQTLNTAGPAGAQPPATGATQRSAATFAYPLQVDNSNPNVVSVIGACDPRSYVCFYDDFVSGSTASGHIGSLGWSASNSAYLSSPPGTFGVLRVNTGSTVNSNVNLMLQSGGVVEGNYGGTTFDVMFRASSSTSTATVKFLWGLANSGTAQEADSDYIGIAYNSATDSNFTYVTRSGGGTENRVASGLAIDTAYHTFRIRSTTPGTVLFSIDGGTETSVTTAVPSARLLPEFQMQNLAASNYNMDVDFYYHVFSINR